MNAPGFPGPHSQEYLWWSQGAADERKAQNEGINANVLEVRDTFEALAKLNKTDTGIDILVSCLWIYLADRPLRKRLRIAWKLIRS